MDDKQKGATDTPQIERTTTSEVTVTPPAEDPPTDTDSNSSTQPDS